MLELPRPSAMQECILRHPGNTVCLAGRRAGKTQVGVYKILLSALETVGLYWWVGLTWQSASMKRAWRLLKFYARRLWRAYGYSGDFMYAKESVHELILPNGSQIWMRTAEREDSLAGEGVRGIVIDEFTLMSESVWSEYLQGTLLDYDGWALFIGVPKGRNWGSELWEAASKRDGWLQIRFTSYDNPNPEFRERLERIKAETPEHIWRQEYLAEILSDGGLVFLGVDEAATASPLDSPEPGHHYVFGIDWGKENDYTVISIFDAGTRRQVSIVRFNEVGWELQKGRVLNAIRLWKPRVVYAEYNSIGGPMVEALQRSVGDGSLADAFPGAAIPTAIHAFMTTNESKNEIIENLSLAIQRRDLQLLNDQSAEGREQLRELKAFALEHLPSGRIRYGAPGGMHDDTVMALAMAYHAIGRASGAVLAFA
jgi:hypothetical protein